MRPAMDARHALVRELERGAQGDFHALAQSAGVAPSTAQATLWNLRRECVVVTRSNILSATGTGTGQRGRGRPRVVYAASAGEPPCAGAVFLGAVLSGWGR